MRKYERGKACGTYEKRDTYIDLVGKSKGRIQLGKPRSIWNNNNNNNNNNNLEILLEVLTVINLVQDRSSGWLF